MNAEYIQLDLWQVSLAAALILVNAAISVLLRLGLEGRLLLASVRTIVQLLLIGLVLQWVLAPGRSLMFVVGLMAAMTGIAGLSALERVGFRYRGIWLDSVLAMWFSSWLIASIGVFQIVRVPADEFAQYAIPLLGMILGNTLNGISIGLDRLGDQFDGRRSHVETLLALGATRWEAARDCVGQAVRTGMIPIINSMSVVGLVSLPGMMTGQLLAGVDPLQAVLYQIVIMFLIAAGTALGTVIVVLAAYRRLFNRDHQFLPHRLRKKG
ncbi:MAG: ABC transporter permease [Thermoguttaceae bacterium]